MGYNLHWNLDLYLFGRKGFGARSVYMYIEQKKGKIVNSQFDHFIWTAEIYCAFARTAEIVLAYARSVHKISFAVRLAFIEKHGVCYNYMTYDWLRKFLCE
jgi:hypothetical protein